MLHSVPLVTERLGITASSGSNTVPRAGLVDKNTKVNRALKLWYRCRRVNGGPSAGCHSLPECLSLLHRDIMLAFCGEQEGGLAGVVHRSSLSPVDSLARSTYSFLVGFTDSLV